MDRLDLTVCLSFKDAHDWLVVFWFSCAGVAVASC